MIDPPLARSRQSDMEGKKKLRRWLAKVIALVNHFRGCTHDNISLNIIELLANEGQ